MARKRVWNLGEMLREMKAWLDDEYNSEILLRQPRMQLKAFLPARNYTGASVALHDLAVWYEALGTARILEGNAEGWNTLHQALLCQYWSMKVEIRLYCNDPKVKYIAASVNTAALCLAHAMAVREDSMADWLGRRMIQSLDDETFGTWGSTPFGPFVVKLFAVWKGIPLDYDDYDVHPLLFYDEIFDAWHDQQRLATALEKACEYHVWQEEKEENEKARKARIEELRKELAELESTP